MIVNLTCGYGITPLNTKLKIMKKKLLYLIISLGSLHSGSPMIQAQTRDCFNTNFTFNVPAKEVNCFRNFQPVTTKNDVNAFFLAKFSELIYPERLDYQIRYLRNGSQPVTYLPSTQYLRDHMLVNDNNFECAYAMRFSNYFYDNSLRPKRIISSTTAITNNLLSGSTTLQLQSSPILGTSGGTASSSSQFTLDSISWVISNVPQFKYIHRAQSISLNFLGFGTQFGLDPELVVINHKDYIIIVWRGTDKLKDAQWGEWIGTDANIPQQDAVGTLSNPDNTLSGTRVMAGFWSSFLLVKEDLLAFLRSSGALNKKIYITGHSLGGAMAIVSGVYLKAAGYPVQNVYAYASPRVIGNDKFRDKANAVLPSRIFRYEYYLDPITLIYAPFYEQFGQRYWIDHKDKGNYQLSGPIPPRFVALNPFEFNLAPMGDSRTAEQVRLYKDKMDGLITELGWKFFFHNPQFYVKGAYRQLTDGEKSVLPNIDDTYPYLYDTGPGETFSGGK